MKRAKSFIVVMVAIALVLSMSTGALAANSKGYAYITVEALSLGNGYILEPTRVSISEGNTVKDVLYAALGEDNYQETATSAGSYLSSVRFAVGDIAVPAYISRAMAEADVELTDTVNNTGFLSEMDYSAQSGWFYLLNNANTGASMDNTPVSNGDVIRLCFSLYGYGADIGADNAAWGSPPLIDFANFDLLIYEVARIKAAAPSGYETRDSYKQALNVLKNMESSEEAVEGIYNQLYVYDITAMTDLVDDWYLEPIDIVMTLGLFQGTSATTFSPNLSMTRGMYVTALARFDEVNLEDYETMTSSFHDVPADAYYAGAVNWAADYGIVDGVGNNAFDPDAPITREQMAKVIVEYADYANLALEELYQPTTFVDANQIGDWATGYVESCDKAGIINGYYNEEADTYSFKPQQTATRAEVATLFCNFLYYLYMTA